MTDTEKFALIMKALDVADDIAKIPTTGDGKTPSNPISARVTVGTCVPRRSVKTDDEGTKPTVDRKSYLERTPAENEKFNRSLSLFVKSLVDNRCDCIEVVNHGNGEVIDDNTIIVNGITVVQIKNGCIDVNPNSYMFNGFTAEEIQKECNLQGYNLHFYILYTRSACQNAKFKSAKYFPYPYKVKKSEDTAVTAFVKEMPFRSDFVTAKKTGKFSKDNDELVLGNLTIKRIPDVKGGSTNPNCYFYNGFTVDEIRNECAKQGYRLCFEIVSTSDIDFDPEIVRIFPVPCKTMSVFNFPTLSETVKKIGTDKNIRFKQVDKNTLVFNDITVKSYPNGKSNECTFNTYDWESILREGIRQGYMIDFKYIHPESPEEKFMVLYKHPYNPTNKQENKVEKKPEPKNTEKCKRNTDDIESIIAEYRQLNPNLTPKQCIEDLNIPRSTVYAHWKTTEPANIPKRENTDTKTDKCAEMRKHKTPRGVCRNMLTQNELFGYIDDCLHEKPLHIPVTVTSDGKEMTLHGITVYNTYKPSHKKTGDEIHVMMPEDYTYNGMTADEVRQEAEKQGKYVFFIMGTPSSFGYPDVSFAHMFRYPMFATTTHQIVQGYRDLYPDARQCDCIRDTGLTRNQVQPNWDK